ncbi:hypothetical protein A2U01_0037022, partial [Trifolium medium]|nr:hypothetical protein [Trifolium medium]
SPIGRGHGHLSDLAPTDDHRWLLEGATPCVRKFRKFWSARHFSLPASDYVNTDDLCPEAAASGRILQKFVDDLELESVSDSRDPSGHRRVFRKRYIDTELVLSEPSSMKRDAIFSEFFFLNSLSCVPWSGNMKDLTKWQRMRAAMEKCVASRPPKPVEVVSSRPLSVAPKSFGRRVAGSITFKPHVEERREAPAIPVGKGKGLLEEGVTSFVKKMVKYSCAGSSNARFPSGP